MDPLQLRALEFELRTGDSFSALGSGSDPIIVVVLLLCSMLIVRRIGSRGRTSISVSPRSLIEIVLMLQVTPLRIMVFEA
jgi:hypothetical protein